MGVDKGGEGAVSLCEAEEGGEEIITLVSNLLDLELVNAQR
jgi:hypothetical protein